MNVDLHTVAVEECPADAPVMAAATLLDGFELSDFHIPEDIARVPPTTNDGTTIASEDLNSAYPWVRAGLQRIAKLSALTHEWHESGVAAPNETAKTLATQALRQLSAIDFQPTTIDASSDEGICISFSASSRRANIECFNTGEVFGAIVRKGAEPCIWEITNGTLSDGIARIYSFIRE